MTTEQATYTRGYDDNYEGLAFATGAELAAELEAWALGPYARLNVPVWVDVPAVAIGEPCEWCNEHGLPGVAVSGEWTCGEHRLEVGILLTRHGEPTIWYTDDWTPDDVQAIRATMLRVWAGRADTGFAR